MYPEQGKHLILTLGGGEQSSPATIEIKLIKDNEQKLDMSEARQLAALLYEKLPNTVYLELIRELQRRVGQL